MDNLPECTVIYRDVKYPRLEYKTATLTLILPKTYRNSEELLRKHQKWIRNKETLIKKALEEAGTEITIENRSKEELKILVGSLIERYEKELDTKINKVFYRKMKTKWASHSCRNNLTINTDARYLPEDLISYIVYHEMVHSLERKHNGKFWKIISRKFPDYRDRERGLLAYWFAIHKT